MGDINKELLLEILGTLTKLRKDYPYTLLLHILEPNQVMKFLDMFQGTTITIPTQQELLECVTFSMCQKYGGWDKTPKEALNGLTKKRYNELLSAINKID